MKKKLKQILIPFILMIIFNLGVYYLTNGENLGGGLSPHVGVLFVSGLLFGPYGAIGSACANLICDIIRGYNATMFIPSFIISFAISYLAYKLWYSNHNKRTKVTRPKINNTTNILIFIELILICGVLYGVMHGQLAYLAYPDTIPIKNLIEFRYFLNFINSAFVFGIIGIWLSNKRDLTLIPKTSSKKVNEKAYLALEILLLISVAATIVINYSIDLNRNIIIAELIVTTLLLCAYLTKPNTINVSDDNSRSIPEDIMNIFHLAILFIIIIGIIISYDRIMISAINKLIPLNINGIMISMMLLIDLLLIIFFIPSFTVLKYIEIKVINPILSFSKIEDFIEENEKIDSEKLVKIYSRYAPEETEIGTLARSYTDLIKFNNNYIDNIQDIQGEKKRIEAELHIATKIQASNLPTDVLTNDDYTVDGYSEPAKEVGGDFFDYYPLDKDHLVITIGDASGKGVPAALLAMNTQVMIKQLLKIELDPSKVVYSINNQLCENNSEAMFITLWLGIYNKSTGKLTFTNAGHNPPLIKENGKFKYLNSDQGIVLGIMENFAFSKNEITLKDEIVLYTDGITDANNANNEMYGEDRLLNFFNSFKQDEPIEPLLKDINKFTKEQEQYDDMTLLYLKTK